MNTKHLEYLLDIGTTHSFSKTADNFYTSHQVVSNSITSLEDEFNIKIVNRSNHGIEFTEEGLIFLNYARSVLKHYTEIQAQLKPFHRSETRSSLSGELSVYFIQRFSNQLFMNLNRKYKKDYPKVNVSLKNTSLNYILNEIVLGETDIIVATIYKDLTSSENDDELLKNLSTQNLSINTICIQKLGLCISKNSTYYKLLQNPEIMKDYYLHEKIPIVSFDYQIDKTYLSRKFDLIFIDNFEIQRELIKAGDYAASCTYLEFKYFFNHPSLIFLPFDDIYLNYVILYSSSSNNNEIVQSFCQKAKEYYSFLAKK